MTDPSLVGVTVEQLIANARRLGLMWGWRPVTVYSVDSPYSQDVCGGIYDGDTAVIPFTNIAGPISIGLRGMGLFVPPNGNYFIGTIGDQRTKTFAISDTSPSVSFGGTETVVLTLDNVLFRAGAAYTISFGQAITSTLNTTIRVRVRVASVVGTVIADYSDYGINVISPRNAAGTAYVKRVDTTDTVVTLVLTMQSGGIPLISGQFASATIPRFLMVRYAGVGSDYPHALVV